MHLNPLLLLALSSAGALTLALPNPNPNPPTNATFPSHHLAPRRTYGWLSSYADTDPTCAGGYGGTRPKVHSDCIKFAPISDHVGINWGTSPLNFNGMNFYSDDKCKHQVGTMDGPSGDHDLKGAQTCVDVKANGGPWGSVQGTGVYWD